MQFYKLKIRDYVSLFLLLAVGYVFATTQKYYVPDIIALRTLFLLLVGILLFLVFFFIVKPAKPYELSKTASAVLGIAVFVIIVIQHVILTFTPSVKNIIVLLVAVIVPYICGFIYTIVKR